MSNRNAYSSFRLQNLGYRVDCVQESWRDYCILELCGFEVFRCNVRHLKFNTCVERDSVAQRAINAVLEGTVAMQRTRTNLWIRTMIAEEIFLRSEYSARSHFASMIEPAPLNITCKACCGTFSKHFFSSSEDSSVIVVMDKPLERSSKNKLAKMRLRQDFRDDYDSESSFVRELRSIDTFVKKDDRASREHSQLQLEPREKSLRKLILDECDIDDGNTSNKNSQKITTEKHFEKDNPFDNINKLLETDNPIKNIEKLDEKDNPKKNNPMKNIDKLLEKDIASGGPWPLPLPRRYKKREGSNVSFLM